MVKRFNDSQTKYTVVATNKGNYDEVINATIAQITVRAKGDDMAIQTFPLTPEASAKMLQVIDKGGYQYGDKVTVFFDPDSKKALKVKGKPSKAI